MAVAVAAVAYASWPSPGAEMSTDPVGFTVPDATSTLVDFKLTKSPEATVTCAVQALNEGYAVVGWEYVTIGPAEESVTHHRAELRTVSLATTGSVHTCWVVGTGS